MRGVYDQKSLQEESGFYECQLTNEGSVYVPWRVYQGRSDEEGSCLVYCLMYKNGRLQIDNIYMTICTMLLNSSIMYSHHHQCYKLLLLNGLIMEVLDIFYATSSTIQWIYDHSCIDCVGNQQLQSFCFFFCH